MTFLAEYGIFLAKAVTIVAAILVVVAGVLGLASKNKSSASGKLKVKKLNEKLQDLKESMEQVIFSEDDLKKQKKENKQKAKAEKKAKSISKDEVKARTFVLDFDGDIKASANDDFREAITSVLQVANANKDEVVVRLESGGGMVHAYGLAAAQMDRIKQKGLKLTVCVDKVAASGGYMMACVADHIVASPFAVMGSIGVVAQLPNFNRLLKKNDIDFELFTAGEHKRTVTMFAENTDKGREKFKADLEDTHELFKGFVREHRPAVNLTEVANGDVWFGRRALEVNLVDDLKTSDEYILDACQVSDVYEVSYEQKKSIGERFGFAASNALEQAFIKLSGFGRSSNLIK
jgi:serine protease SohB